MKKEKTRVIMDLENPKKRPSIKRLSKKTLFLDSLNYSTFSAASLTTRGYFCTFKTVTAIIKKRGGEENGK